jgi:hypothetical protein
MAAAIRKDSTVAKKRVLVSFDFDNDKALRISSSVRHSCPIRLSKSLAQELEKTRFQVIGYRNGSAHWAVPGVGRTYRWNWDNLKKLLA